MDDTSWRQTAVSALAILLWLLAWFAGWLAGGVLAPGSWLWATVGGFGGWCVGLGLATLILFLNETL